MSYEIRIKVDDVDYSGALTPEDKPRVMLEVEIGTPDGHLISQCLVMSPGEQQFFSIQKEDEEANASWMPEITEMPIESTMAEVERRARETWCGWKEK